MRPSLTFLGDALKTKIIDEAFEIYVDLVDPAGIRADIPIADFGVIYRGEGRNAPRTPLEAIFPDARRLTLFAVTRNGYRGRVRSLPGCGCCGTVRVTAAGTSVVRESSSRFFGRKRSVSRSTRATSCSR